MHQVVHPNQQLEHSKFKQLLYPCSSPLSCNSNSNSSSSSSRLMSNSLCFRVLPASGCSCHYLLQAQHSQVRNADKRKTIAIQTHMQHPSSCQHPSPYLFVRTLPLIPPPTPNST